MTDVVDKDRQGNRGAWIVVGGLLGLAALLAIFLVYPNLKESAAAIQLKLNELDETGRGMTGEECVRDVVGWHETCDVIATMCLQEVPTAVAHCLAARDRAEECEVLLQVSRTAQWTYQQCAAIGVDKTSSRETRKACTQAWDALYQFCQSGQHGVIWGVK